MAKETALSNASLFVSTVVSNITVTGTYTISVVEQETVTNDYDLSFNKTLSETDSASFINGFQLYDNPANSNTLAVQMRTSGKAAWKNVVSNVVTTATDATSKTLLTVLTDQGTDILIATFGDEVANILEAAEASNYDLSGALAAETSWTDLSNNSAGTLLIAQQIPNANYMAYTDVSEQMITDALPLLTGNSVVLFFNVTTTLTATDPEVLNPTSGNPTSGFPTVTSADPGTLADLVSPLPSFTAVSNKKVAYFIKVLGTDSRTVPRDGVNVTYNGLVNGAAAVAEADGYYKFTSGAPTS